ncbi:Type II secretion system protein [Desulfarculales bacterium]
MSDTLLAADNLRIYDILLTVIMRPQMPRPLEFKRWEWWLLVLAVGLLVFLATYGKGRRERLAYERFLKLAPQVQAALERFAADHDGQFPPDAMMTSRPAGLNDKYIKWRKSWKIDYEVHDNEQDGQSVCLEFCGPFDERLYFGLCKNPEYRHRYGRGQLIPGHVNRIWVVKEDAAIMEELSPDGQDQKQSPSQAPPAAGK